MVRLVDDLLDVARITRGKIRLRAERVDVGEVVAAALETARPLCEAHQHEVDVRVTPELAIEADSVRLAQVLGNLLNNAAKYTPDGGRISVSAMLEGREVVFRVRDTGMGITPEMLPKVFDLFAQGDNSIDRSQGGLGIGLTLVRLLVELQGGRVEAHSEGPGQGSEFTVRMPALADAPAGPTRAEPASDGLPRRVLVVDDNVDAADSMSLVLRLTGHTTRTAHDGPTALELARSFSPEVVLLDIGLPGLNGYEVARRLRDDPTTAGALVIAVSGYGLDSDRERSREAGFDHHLTKPVDYEELRGLLAGRRGGKAG
jgi:CheY-like chemotaxis protein